MLGLAVATMLYEAVPQEPEGSLSKRLAMLVSGASCAEVARAIGAGPHIRMGKQARDDGARDSVNVLGDVVEALIGALYLDGGLDAATAFVRRAWEPRMRGTPPAPQHPKSALQEWAAANRRRPPVYLVVDRSGPGHAPKFVVQVEIGAAGSARGEGSSKQDAETAAAAALLRQLRGG
ncbi:ribonuclease-3 [Sphingomonas jejuensis]|uniref:Ribonuclease-3 n=1 Tax=Sphingomonas jejuensis TaxID=904715 RepID=A0ABX0XKV0_9SPHN|nr:ribonuclease-3 [Sphingomonas jejuensis]